MKIAYVTEYGNWLKNQMFLETASCNVNNVLDRYIALKDFLAKQDIDLNTFDTYSSIDEVDIWLMQEPTPGILEFILKNNIDLSRVIYFLHEPPVYNYWGWDYIRKSHYLYEAILTWETTSTKSNGKFFHYHFPVKFDPGKREHYLKKEKKNLCLIMHSNKTSQVRGELYGLRRDVIKYFENRGDHLLDVYGHGWNNDKAPLAFFTNLYKGTTPDKRDTYAEYYYSFCIDNCISPGYITYDPLISMVTGIVPVYMPMPDSKEFIPEDTFIDMSRFKTLDELTDHLLSIKNTDEYEQLKKNGWEFVTSERYHPFTVEKFSQDVFTAIRYVAERLSSRRNGKITMISPEKAQKYLNPHFTGILPMKNGIRYDEMDPEKLFSHKRFDLAAKYIYVKHRDMGVDCDWARRLYSEHIKAFNGYLEPDGSGKKGEKAFIDSFDTTIDSIRVKGFDDALSMLPITQSGDLIEGSHRLAACTYYRKPVKTLGFSFDTWAYPYDFFLKRGLSANYCDAMAYEYCKLKENTYLALLFPSAVGHDDEARTILQQYGSIFYEKEVRLFNNGPLLLMTQIYKNENWLGDLSNNFGGAHTKARECFRSNSPLRVFLVETDNQQGLKDAKDKIRAIYKISNHSIHINDTHDETVRVSQLLFNENSIHFLNHATLKALPQFQKHYRTLRQACAGKDHNEVELLCVTGSAVMALYGIRDARDIDYFHFGNALPEDPAGGLGSHNKEVHNYTTTRDDIIFNPENHFYFDNFKFASLDVVRTMKEKRGEEKDKVDVGLIRNFLGATQEDPREKQGSVPFLSHTTPLVSIILLNYNGFEDIRSCIDSISRNTPESHEIVVFDNASTDSSPTYLRSLPGIFLVESPVNLGCPAGRAQAMTYIHPASRYIIFLDNDTVVTKGWITKFITHTERDRTIGIMGPRSNYVSGTQLVRDVSYSNIKELESFALQWSLKNKGVSTPTHRLIGFCMFITRDVIEKVGSIDASFGKFGFEDDDYTWRTVVAGFKAMIANDVFIHHKGGPQGQGNKVYNEAMLGAWETFKNKWGIPEEVSYGNPIMFSAIFGQPFNKEKHYIPLVSKRDETSYHEFGKGNVSIIVLTRNQLDYTKKCVKSIFRHTPQVHEIIFVDNGSADNTVLWVKRFIKENKNCRLIENKGDLGFAKGCNLGMEASTGEFIVLLGNDVEVSQGWLSGMLECLEADPGAGFIGPMANLGHNMQKAVVEGYGAAGLDKAALFFREKYRNRRIPGRKLEGFCLFFRRTLVEKIGLFDETFTTDDLAAEDICLRAALEGCQNYIAGDIYVHRNLDRVLSKDRTAISRKWTLSTAEPEGEKLAVLRAAEIADEAYHKGDIEQAVETLVNCIKVSPDAKEIYYMLVRIFIETKRFAEAWDVVGTMPGPVRDSIKGLECSAYAKEGLGLDEEAAPFTGMMLALDGRYSCALNMKGVLAYKKGDRETAQDFFQRATEADPGYGEAYTNLGVLYWGMDRKDDAMANLRRGFILSPIVPDVNSLYYSAASSLGTYSEAETDLRDAVALYPDSKNLAFLHIDSLIQQGKPAEAMLRIEDALDLFGPDEGTLNAALAVRETIGPLQIEKGLNKSTLSLCMIVKNEEKHLVKCLLSVRGIVDEIIVVDTGSTDKTISIAKVFGAGIFEFPWTGDFSAARNQSLVRASGDWILVLDADEVISSLDHGRLLKTIDRGDGRPVAFDIITRNYLARPGSAGWTENDGSYPHEEKGVGWFGSNKVRLFRNNGPARFENPVHELLEASLKRAGISIEKCDIPIHHYGRLDQDKLLAKGRDYYLLGRNKLEQRGGGDYVALRELAVQAGELGIFAEAVDLWQQALSVRPDDVDALFNLGYSYMQIGKYREALHASRRAVELSPGTEDAVLNYALSEMFLGDAPKAATLLEEFLSNGKEHPVLMVVLGTSYLICGNNDKGLAIFKKLAEKQINPVAYANSLLEQLIKSGRFDYFNRLVDAAISNNIADRETLRRQVTPALNKIAREFQVNGKTDQALLILNAVFENRLNNEETGSLFEALQTI